MPRKGAAEGGHVPWPASLILRAAAWMLSAACSIGIPAASAAFRRSSAVMLASFPIWSFGLPHPHDIHIFRPPSRMASGRFPDHPSSKRIRGGVTSLRTFAQWFGRPPKGYQRFGPTQELTR